MKSSFPLNDELVAIRKKVLNRKCDIDNAQKISMINAHTRACEKVKSVKSDKLNVKCCKTNGNTKNFKIC